MKKIKESADKNVEILLLGNKTDLINDRVISEEESIECATRLNIDHFETSAKDSTNVDHAFKQLINNIL
jgi:GTPase SAR1 family protein